MSNVKKSNVKILEHELVFAHIGHLLLLLLLSCSEHRSGCDGFLADGRKPIGLLQKADCTKALRCRAAGLLFLVEEVEKNLES